MYVALPRTGKMTSSSSVYRQTLGWVFNPKKITAYLDRLYQGSSWTLPMDQELGVDIQRLCAWHSTTKPGENLFVFELTWTLSQSAENNTMIQSHI